MCADGHSRFLAATGEQAFGFSIPSLFTVAGALMLAGVAAGAPLVPLYKRQAIDTAAAEADL